MEKMKKGLTMLVAAMVVIGLICMIGSAAATTEAAIGTVAEIVFGVMVMAGVVALYIAISAKKGHTRKRPGRLAKTLNAVILAGMVAINARHTRIMHTTGIPASPRMLARTCRTDLDTR